jgi:hypothetical protein
VIRTPPTDWTGVFTVKELIKELSKFPENAHVTFWIGADEHLLVEKLESRLQTEVTIGLYPEEELGD